MNKEDLLEITKIVTKATDDAASNAVAKLHEFHIDEMKVLGERMDIGFESVNRRIDSVESRLDGVESRLVGVESRLLNVETKIDLIDERIDRVENALATLLKEFKDEREKVDELKKQISELTIRVQMLEKQLATAR